jgi:hypothetical protein
MGHPWQHRPATSAPSVCDSTWYSRDDGHGDVVLPGGITRCAADGVSILDRGNTYTNGILDTHQHRKLVTPTGWKEFEALEADLQGSRWAKPATIGND